MGRLITFDVTCMGASHVKNNKPCQDYSLSWHSDDNRVQVAIVCDGHGGDTYVRSDRGSRLAAEIALRNIRNAVSCMSPDLFMDKDANLLHYHLLLMIFLHCHSKQQTS